MKILRLRFQNIHSLKGWHSIDFTEPPLSEAGLFAITGPTGAGKSTILDVITLALFNRIPRIDSRITPNEMEKAGSIMTHHTTEAAAEVDYETDGKSYRSTWQISRKKDGGLRDYKMFVAKLPENLFEDIKKSEVPAYNESVIGLNYDQFVRSILLSQGEFAKFLRSDEKERAGLLEKITGTEIYRRLGMAAYAKSQQVQRDVLAKKQHIDSMAVLTPQQVQEKKNGIEGNKIRLEILSKEFVEKSASLTKILRIERLQQDLIRATDKLKDILQQKEQFEPRKLRLERHKALDPHRGGLALYDHDRKKLAALQEDLNRTADRIKTLEEDLKTAIVKMGRLTGLPITEENFLQEMQNFEALIGTLDDKLNNVAEQGQIEKNRYLSFLKANNDNRIIGQLENSAITSHPDPVKEMLSRLTNKHPEPRKISEIEAEEKAVRDLKQVWDSRIYEARQHQATVVQIKALQSQSGTLAKNLEEMETMKIKEDEALETYGLLVENLEKQKEHNLAVASLDDHRSHLIPGQPCPLCGSDDHPYAGTKVLADLGKTELELSQARQQLKTSREIKDRITESIVQARTRLEEIKQQIEERQQSASAIEAQWTHYGSGLPDLAMAEEQANKLQNRIDVLAAEADEVATLTLLSQATVMLSDILRLKDEHENISRQRQQRYTGKDVRTDTNRIQNEYVSARDVLIENKSRLITRGKEASALRSSVTAYAERLGGPLKALGYNDILMAQADVLSDQEHRDINETNERLTTEEIAARTTVEGITGELKNTTVSHIATISKEDLTLEIRGMEEERTSLDREIGALSNELTQNEEVHKTIKKELKELAQLQQDAKGWLHLNELIGDATGNKYSKYAQNLSLRHLIHLANKRLSDLNDRYVLDFTDIETDLTVVDLYQGRTTRSVRTLSGGESFIVSLALALSLSDMASENVQLDSLFIDEGFGTLDSEMLETAIDTLERLQSNSGRTIGIISHIESLKERITTQIRVQKNGQGYSSLEVI